MTYAMSDIHGCYDKFAAALEKISFSSNDTLYILGDIVDRGPDGIKIILDISKRENVIALRGNHDHEALVLLKNLALPSDDPRADEFIGTFKMWAWDGGMPTYESFLKLSDDGKREVLAFLNSMPVYEEIEIGKQKYFLSHTVPEKEKIQDFDHCNMADFLTGHPEYEKVYFDDKIIVTGHTPTGLIDKDFSGRIWRKNNHAAIDCGAVFGKPLGCICLETGQEFYAD